MPASDLGDIHTQIHGEQAVEILAKAGKVGGAGGIEGTHLEVNNMDELVAGQSIVGAAALAKSLRLEQRSHGPLNLIDLDRELGLGHVKAGR